MTGRRQYSKQVATTTTRPKFSLGKKAAAAGRGRRGSSQQQQQQLVQVPRGRKTISAFRELKEGQKLFHGFKAKLIYERRGDLQENREAIHLETDVRYSNANLNEELPTIIMRDNQGREVVRVPDVKYHYVNAVKGTEPGNPNGLAMEIVPENDIKHYQVIQGQEIFVGKFERTKDIVVDHFLPKTELDMWAVEGTYEIWGDHTHPLYEMAKDLERTDEIGVSKFSFGGFKENYALISSVREGDRFVITMSLARKRRRYSHPMDWSDERNDFKQETKRVSGLLDDL